MLAIREMPLRLGFSLAGESIEERIKSESEVFYEVRIYFFESMYALSSFAFVFRLYPWVCAFC